MTRRRRRENDGSYLFPGYTDIAEIGLGSLSTVFRGRELATNRLVALKLLNVRDASPRAIESFERESLALGVLSSHPNIVTLYRLLHSSDGRPVLVLELCRGSMGSTGGTPMPVHEVLGVGIKVAGALETAHRGGILHRDVKPQNILITEFGEPALSDFGVAMLQSSTQTTAGLFDFTTLHAAPELLEGRPTSPATDVYELASTLYQLLSGQSAFRAYEGESPASVILRILRDPVRPVLLAGVPTQLSDLLVRAMSKDMQSRPPTAAEFAGELARIEDAQGWPRTPFLIRGPEAVVRGPEAVVRGPESVAAVPPTLVRPLAAATTGPIPIPVPAARQPAPPTPPPVAPTRQPPPVQAPPPRPVPQQPPPGPLAPVARPAYPAPPAYPLPPVEALTSQADAEVPVWTRRRSTLPPAAVDDFADLSIDPMSLRRRYAVRSGLGAVVADARTLTLRQGLRRTRLPWPDVLALEPMADQDGAKGMLVAVTATTRLDLPPTRTPMANLRYVHAMLDAYRKRARMQAER